MGDDDAVPILVVGDVNPDLVLTGDVVPRFGQAEQLLTGAGLVLGGSGAITAHGLARLGRATRLLAAVGPDPFGELVRGWLESGGVDTTGVVRRADTATGLTVVLVPAEGDRAMLTHPGAVATLTPDEVRAAVADPAVEHVHVASLFLQPHLVADLPALLEAARSRGATVSLDTNDDPAGTWLGVDELLPHVDVLLPNRAEACALAQTDDVRAAAATLAGSGPLVVVKDGADGAVAATPDGALLHAPGVPADVVDTTGAGDTFDAAFLDAWLDGRDLPACLDRAVAAGARAVAAIGGTAGQPDRNDLDHDERSRA